MIGITAFGGYVPFQRLRREAIQKEAGGSGGAKGERAVAGYDEDSATMAVAAALNATGAGYGLKAGAAFFATTTPPYAEKQSDSMIAAALDLPSTLRTAEFTSTLRAGTTALLAAADAVANGAGPALVMAADMRDAGPMGANESAFGDGAAALMIGSENLLAALVGSASVSMEIVDAWRNQGDAFVRNWDDRYQLELGFGRAIPRAFKALAEKIAVEPASVARVVLPASPKIQDLLLKLGFKREQIADSMTVEVGLTGAAHPLLMLVRELESAKPGDRILVFSYGEGADALLFEVTDRIGSVKPARSVADMIQTKRNDMTYATFLKWRRMLEVEPPRRPEPGRPSSPYMNRKSKVNLGLYGSRCRKCSTAQFPAQRVCYKCRARDEMDDYGFRDKRGRLSTFSADYLTHSLNPPEIVAVVDFDGGGRMMCNMVDSRPDELQIGQTVEMTLRRLFTSGGIHSYFWKARGVR